MNNVILTTCAIKMAQRHSWGKKILIPATENVPSHTVFSGLLMDIKCLDGFNKDLLEMSVNLCLQNVYLLFVVFTLFIYQTACRSLSPIKIGKCFI